MTRHLLVVTAAVLLAGVQSGGASAARPPARGEADAIRFALAHDARTCCLHPSGRITRLRVSTVDPHFASAELERLDKSGRIEDVFDALLWRGTKRWAVIDAGSDVVGCSFVVAKVRRDLFGSTVCPP